MRDGVRRGRENGGGGNALRRRATPPEGRSAAAEGGGREGNVFFGKIPWPRPTAAAMAIA